MFPVLGWALLVGCQINWWIYCVLKGMWVGYRGTTMVMHAVQKCNLVCDEIMFHNSLGSLKSRPNVVQFSEVEIIIIIRGTWAAPKLEPGLPPRDLRGRWRHDIVKGPQCRSRLTQHPLLFDGVILAIYCASFLSPDSLHRNSPVKHNYRDMRSEIFFFTTPPISEPEREVRCECTYSSHELPQYRRWDEECLEEIQRYANLHFF